MYYLCRYLISAQKNLFVLRQKTAFIGYPSRVKWFYLKCLYIQIYIIIYNDKCQ